MPELARLALPGGEVILREAREGDVPVIVELLAADQLGARRERTGTALEPAYRDAFRAIDADPNHLLVVAQSDGRTVGTFQLSFLPGLARRGAWRAQIEAVRVADGERGRGLGAAMMRWAIAEAGRRGCTLVQLTSDRRRPDAHRFYTRLGFEATHEGFKRTVSAPDPLDPPDPPDPPGSDRPPAAGNNYREEP